MRGRRSFFDLYTGFTRVGHFERLTFFLAGTQKSLELIFISNRPFVDDPLRPALC